MMHKKPNVNLVLKSVHTKQKQCILQILLPNNIPNDVQELTEQGCAEHIVS